MVLSKRVTYKAKGFLGSLRRRAFKASREVGGLGIAVSSHLLVIETVNAAPKKKAIVPRVLRSPELKGLAAFVASYTPTPNSGNTESLLGIICMVDDGAASGSVCPMGCGAVADPEIKK
ncbi:hypothetical protein F3Y22_tig00111095pilonHSYRG00624 [Hibiscus syriacus]|uniref:Uncharacterized protein n=1 Tax=Hibiscus syriacus TaxID=106335 RepID=A0A6A2Z3N4_HIBSY|nr:hypothetical protein F3Y22_tig00111095pilonHSYRG00624 [Hibiscus syriacus]